MLQIGVDGMNELGDTVDGQPFELPFVEFTEEAFHDIGPGGPGGDEVEVDPGDFWPTSSGLFRACAWRSCRG